MSDTRAATHLRQRRQRKSERYFAFPKGTVFSLKNAYFVLRRDRA
jgi:hypothetical protein